MALAVLVTGCSAILGVSDVPEPVDAATTTTPDAQTTPSADSGAHDASTTPLDGDVVEPTDASSSADADAAPVLTVPPVPGRAGFDVVSGGALSRSTNFALVGATGEAPGWNGLSASPSFKLKGGLVPATQ